MPGFLRRNAKKFLRRIPRVVSFYFKKFFGRHRPLSNSLLCGGERDATLASTEERVGRGLAHTTASYLLPPESQTKEISNIKSQVPNKSEALKIQFSKRVYNFGNWNLKFIWNLKFKICNFYNRLRRNPIFILKPLRATVAVILIAVFVTQLFQPAPRNTALGATFTFTQSGWGGEYLRR